MQLSELRNRFEKIFRHAATDIFFAPGRVNLIGEHTDYNGGYVFPCALSFGTFLLIAPNSDNVLRFCSLNITDACGANPITEVPLAEATRPLEAKHWANYPLGCIAQFVKRGVILPQGYDFLFWGDVPAGAGLSSSAAIEVVTAYAVNEMLHTGYDRTEIAKIGQLSEHEFAGVNCGIMDQFASAQGKADHVIFLNCDTLEFHLVPVKLQGIKVVITNTHSPHKLDSGAYNARVAQCKTAVDQLNTVRPLNNLAELTMEEFQKIESAITDPVAHHRARHVVGEVQRTKDAVEALRRGDILRFGELMNQSHISLRDDYEVTGPELDTLAETAWTIDGVIGSRMTGGGFGGCTVSLVREEAIPTYMEVVGKTYTAKTGLTPDFYIAQIGDGVHRVE